MAKSMEAWYAELDALTEKHPSNLCLKHLAGEGKGYYDGLSDDLKARFAKCVASGLENADSSVGVYAMMPKDYEELAQYFDRVRPCPRPAAAVARRASAARSPAALLIRLRRGGRPGGPRPRHLVGRDYLVGGPRPARRVPRSAPAPRGFRPLPEERRKAPAAGRPDGPPRQKRDARTASPPRVRGEIA